MFIKLISECKIKYNHSYEQNKKSIKVFIINFNLIKFVNILHFKYNVIIIITNNRKKIHTIKYFSFN